VKNASGFTLIETIIAAGILAVASASIATLFVSSVETNLNNGDRTAAALLLSDKLEQLSVAPLSDSQWLAGNYCEYVSLGFDGNPIVSATDSTLKYLRTWQISATQPKTLTIVLFSNHSAVTGQQTELIRATLLAAAKW